MKSYSITPHSLYPGYFQHHWADTDANVSGIAIIHQSDISSRMKEMEEKGYMAEKIEFHLVGDNHAY